MKILVNIVEVLLRSKTIRLGKYQIPKLKNKITKRGSMYKIINF